MECYLMSQESHVTILRCQIRISYAFESSPYELIRNIRELDAYATHFILRKFGTHVHLLRDSYKCK